PRFVTLVWHGSTTMCRLSRRRPPRGRPGPKPATFLVFVNGVISWLILARKKLNGKIAGIRYAPRSHSRESLLALLDRFFICFNPQPWRLLGQATRVDRLAVRFVRLHPQMTQHVVTPAAFSLCA